MNESLSVRGGARVGWVNYTWPLANLVVSDGQMSIEVTFDQKYVFRPEDVVSLQRYGFVPILAIGVRVVHTNAAFPEEFIFWHFGSPERLIQRIISAGFQPRGLSSAIPERKGMPFRWSFLVAVVIGWNVLFLADRFRHAEIGGFSLAALAGMCAISLGLLKSERIQRLALKSGRFPSEVRGIAQLLMVISGGLFVGFLFVGVRLH